MVTLFSGKPLLLYLQRVSEHHFVDGIAALQQHDRSRKRSRKNDRNKSFSLQCSVGILVELFTVPILLGSIPKPFADSDPNTVQSM